MPGCAAGSQGESEAEVESDGRLCKVRKFVQVQAVDLEVGDLINKTSIFGPNAKIPRHIKVHAAAVRKGSTNLTIDSIREIVDGIENKRAATRQGTLTCECCSTCAIADVAMRTNPVVAADIDFLIF
jgi:hypothetical protein